MSIRPRSRVPELSLPLAGGGRFTLTENRPASFSMLVFYRGLHCPICKTYLRDLDARLDDFAAQGVDAVAVSTDSRERAEQARWEWDLEHLRIAYGIGIDEAREWGLSISRSIKETEPPLFAEPGVFLVRPDGTLYCSSVQTMPFARPAFGEILNAVKFVTENDYPARGEA